MFCSKCGMKCDDEATFCAKCGAHLGKGETSGSEDLKSGEKMAVATDLKDILEESMVATGGNTGADKLVNALSGKGRLAKYFSFKGRATSKEFIITTLILAFIIYVTIEARPQNLMDKCHDLLDVYAAILGWLRLVQTILVVLISCWALGSIFVRRMHDIGCGAQSIWLSIIIPLVLCPIRGYFGLGPCLVSIALNAIWCYLTLSFFAIFCNGVQGTNAYGEDPNPSRQYGRMRIFVGSIWRRICSAFNNVVAKVVSDNAPNPFGFLFNKCKCNDVPSRKKLLCIIVFALTLLLGLVGMVRAVMLQESIMALAL